MPQDEQHTSSVHLKALNVLYVHQLHKATLRVIAPAQILQQEGFRIAGFEKLSAVIREVPA